MTYTCTLTLRRDLAAPSTARRAVSVLLPHWELDDAELCERVLLVVSELVADAVVRRGAETGLHPDPAAPVLLDLSVEAERVVVTVADRSPCVPRSTAPAADGSTTRLHVVSRLARSWGSQPCVGGGLRLFAELARTPSAVA